MRCPKSRLPIQIIVFDKLELIIFVSQGLTLSTASLVHSNCRWANPHPVGWCLPHSFQLCSVFWSSYCYSDQLHSVNWIFCVSKWSLMCFVLRQSNHKILFFRIYFCLKTRNETSLVTSMGLCLAEEENLNQRKKKSLMKALKMSIIHCVVFIISWTPYTFMATW